MEIGEGRRQILKRNVGKDVHGGTVKLVRMKQRQPGPDVDDERLIGLGKSEVRRGETLLAY